MLLAAGDGEHVTDKRNSGANLDERIQSSLFLSGLPQILQAILGWALVDAGSGRTEPVLFQVGGRNAVRVGTITPNGEGPASKIKFSYPIHFSVPGISWGEITFR